jgi:hypothetical protein
MMTYRVVRRGARLSLVAVGLALAVGGCAGPTPAPTTGEPGATVTAADGLEMDGAPVGAISGSLQYPSDAIPALDIYAIRADNPIHFYHVTTQMNQQTFDIANVVAGDYVVVAYLADNSAPGMAAAYTRAAACGMGAECTDHSPQPVTVLEGQTADGVLLHDWNATDLPARPSVQP